MRDNGLAQAVALAAQLGFSIACPMLAFIGGGAWLDGQFRTGPLLLLLGVFLGMLAAGGALYRLTTVQSSKRSGIDTSTGEGGTKIRKTQAPYKVETEREREGLGTNRAIKKRRDRRPR